MGAKFSRTVPFNFAKALERLPNELLENIVNQMDRKSLIALSFANVHLRNVAEKALWMHIEVHAFGDQSPALSNLLTTLHDRRELGLNIKHITVLEGSAERRGNFRKQVRNDKNLRLISLAAETSYNIMQDSHTNVQFADNVLSADIHRYDRTGNGISGDFCSWDWAVEHDFQDARFALLLALCPNLETLSFGYVPPLSYSTALVRSAYQNPVMFQKLQHVSLHSQQLSMRVHMSDTPNFDYWYMLPALRHLDLQLHQPGQHRPTPLSVQVSACLESVHLTQWGEDTAEYQFFLQSCSKLKELMFYASGKGNINGLTMHISDLFNSLQSCTGTLETLQLVELEAGQPCFRGPVDSLTQFDKLKHLKMDAEPLLGIGYGAEILSGILPSSIETLKLRLRARILPPDFKPIKAIVDQLHGVLEARSRGYLENLQLISLQVEASSLTGVGGSNVTPLSLMRSLTVGMTEESHLMQAVIDESKLDLGELQVKFAVVGITIAVKWMNAEGWCKAE